MGTHPIFESDFDCLTESRKKFKMSDYPALRQQIETKGDAVIANDPRFVNTNRARQCWVNYADYYRCLAVRQQNGKDTEPCTYFKNQFLQICPLKWTEEFVTNVPIDASQQKSTPWSLQIPLNQNKRDSSEIIRLFNFGLTLIYYPLIYLILGITIHSNKL